MRANQAAREEEAVAGFRVVCPAPPCTNSDSAHYPAGGGGGKLRRMRDPGAEPAERKKRKLNIMKMCYNMSLSSNSTLNYASFFFFKLLLRFSYI